MNLVRIDKLFNYEKGSLQSSKNVVGIYNFITASADWKKHNEYSHDTEALVFAAGASGSLGRTHYVKGKFIASDLCYILTPKDPENLPVDLQFYHIIFNELRNDIVRKTKSGTSKEAISLLSFGKYEIPYFDINVQHKIKHKFKTSEETKNEISSENTHQLDLLKKLRQQILQDAVQGKLVPQDPNDEPASKLLERIKAEKEKLVREKKIRKEKPLPPIKPEEIPFEIPENWVWCRLGEIASNITKGSSPNWQGIKYVKSEEEGVLFITSKNVGNYTLIFDELTYVEKEFNEIEPRSILRKNDLLTNIVGGSIGRTAMYDLDKIANINQAVCLIRFETSGIDLKYFLHLMNSNMIIDLMFKNQFAPGRANLSMSNIAGFCVPLPPINEQNRIVIKIEQLMKLSDELEQTIQQNQKYTQDLLRVALKEALEPSKD